MPKIKVKDIEMHYEIYGEGEPLLLIMGLGMDINGWIFQVPEFLAHFKVVIFDNRGIGKTSAPPGPYSTKMMANDTAELMNILGVESTHILGISMGGMIAQELAINYPKKVRKLILACTYSEPDELARQIMEQGIIQLAGGKVKTIEEITPDMLSMDIRKIMDFMLPFSLSETFIKQNRQIIDEMLKMVSENATVEGFLGQVVATQKHNTTDKLNKIFSETLVITGDKDILVAPENSKILAENIAGAKLVIIEGGTHGFNCEQKDEFNAEIIKFLKG